MALLDGRREMDVLAATVDRLWRAAKFALYLLWYALPPYRRIEGRLVAKEAASDGTYYILVDEEMVELDSFTFDTLMEGEALRIRCTRDNRAISIDRVVP